MKSFSITEQQIARIIGASIADEASRRFNRHYDFLTIAAWSGETKLGEGGLSLSPEELRVCGERVSGLFGLKTDFLADDTANTLQDWAAKIGSAITAGLDYFTFKSAARDEDHALRRHRADEIYQDAAGAANIIYGRRRLLSLVAPHSLLGFELTILTPNLQRIDSIDARGMTPEELSQTLAYGDVLVATPTLWRYMMREELKSPDNTMAVSFGEAMAPELAAEMRKAGFSVLRELYGSTETGLVGWRDAPTQPFVLFDHWSHEGDEPARLLPDGNRRVGNAMDVLEWTGARSFRLAGRRDGAVQIGAVNVFPDDVVRQLREHPRIADCIIKVDQPGEAMTRLVAHIVLKSEYRADEQTARDIDAWCRTTLRQQERPRIYHFHDSLKL